jgi:succinate dehydrogenase / fumarate reductase iron-sulfur subunit
MGNMKLNLKIWRQNGPNDKGQMVTYPVNNVSEDMSFLEMLDVLNDDLVRKGEDPIAFDHDCREGICGSAACSSMARRTAPAGITTCQLHMRKFKDGDTIHVEPWRSEHSP